MARSFKKFSCFFLTHVSPDLFTVLPKLFVLRLDDGNGTFIRFYSDSSLFQGGRLLASPTLKFPCSSNCYCFGSCLASIFAINFISSFHAAAVVNMFTCSTFRRPLPLPLLHVGYEAVYLFLEFGFYCSPWRRRLCTTINTLGSFWLNLFYRRFMVFHYCLGWTGRRWLASGPHRRGLGVDSEHIRTPFWIHGVLSEFICVVNRFYDHKNIIKMHIHTTGSAR